MLITHKAPHFWYPEKQNEPNWVQKLLYPISRIYGWVVKRKATKATPYKSSLPVICLGNAVAGGAGKTPCAITVFKMVQRLGLSKNPCFLIRGYGGQEKGPLLVDRSKHDSKVIGDEARMLSKTGPVIVSADRKLGAKLAEQQGFDAIIMDDGYQNFGLAKDIHILVIDARGFGNKHLIPAGPLREEINVSLDRADAILFTGDPDPEDMDVIYNSEKPCFTTYHKAYELEEYNLEKPYIGFAGIGNPEKFKLTLQMTGFNVVDFHAFPDHHEYEKKELKELRALAKARGAKLITTSKDFVRLPKKYKEKIHKLETKLKIVEKDDFENFIKQKFNAQKS